MPDDVTRLSDEVLAALVMSLREELVAAHAVSARISEKLELAVQRIAELEARLASNAEFEQAAVVGRPGRAGAEDPVVAWEDAAEAGRAARSRG